MGAVTGRSTLSRNRWKYCTVANAYFSDVRLTHNTTRQTRSMRRPYNCPNHSTPDAPDNPSTCERYTKIDDQTRTCALSSSQLSPKMSVRRAVPVFPSLCSSQYMFGTERLTVRGDSGTIPLRHTVRQNIRTSQYASLGNRVFASMRPPSACVLCGIE